MGCLFSKIEDDVEVVDIEKNNDLILNLKFYDNIKKKKVVDFYDIGPKGRDAIF